MVGIIAAGVLLIVGAIALLLLMRVEPTQAEIEAAQDAALARVSRGETVDDKTMAMAECAARRKRFREAEEDRKRHGGAPPAAALGVLLALAAVPALAQAPAAADRDSGPASVAIQAGGAVTLAGESPTDDTAAAVTPVGFLHLDVPVPWGGGVLARLAITLGFGTAPGEAANVTAIEAFRSADVDAGLYHVIAETEGVRLSLLGESGFSTRVPSGGASPLDRLARYYAAGFRLDTAKPGLHLSATYGRDELGGDRGWGQFRLRMAIPVAGVDLGAARGALVLRADAILTAAPKAATYLRTRDVFRVMSLANVEWGKR